MADRDELVSVPMKRADAEALAVAAAIGLGVNEGLKRVTVPSTAERGLEELRRAIGRRGATVTPTMSRIEASVLRVMAEDGLRVWDALDRRLAGQLPVSLDELDADAGRRGLNALRAAS